MQFGLRYFHFVRFLKGILCGPQFLKCRNSNGLEFMKLIIWCQNNVMRKLKKIPSQSVIN